MRQVQRETLASEERFAIAPPSGVSPYSPTRPGEIGDVLLSELGDDEIRRPTGHPGDARARRLATKDSSLLGDEELARLAESEAKGEAITIEGSPAVRPALQPPVSARDSDDRARTRSYSASKMSPHRSAGAGAGGPPPAAALDSRVAAGDQKMKQISQSVLHSDKTIVIEGITNRGDAEGNRRASDRANLVKNQLIDQGVAPARIKTVTKVDPNQPERVRLVAQAARADEPRPAAGGKALDVDARREPLREQAPDVGRPRLVGDGLDGARRHPGRGGLPLRRRA